MLKKYVEKKVAGYSLELIRIKDRIEYESGAFEMGVSETMYRLLKSASLIVYPGAIFKEL